MTLKTIGSLALALTISASVPAVAAAPAPAPAIDLLSRFLLGAGDGTVMDFKHDSVLSTVRQAGPGLLEVIAPGEPSMIFVTTDKGGCVYDISMKRGGLPAITLEIDANKLRAIAYGLQQQDEKLGYYSIMLSGPDDVLRSVATDGSLSSVPLSSTFSTSLSIDAMQAALTEFQSTYCKAMA